MGVPFISQKSHKFDFMKEILRKDILNINFDVTKSMYFFPENISFLSISFIKSFI